MPVRTAGTYGSERYAVLLVRSVTHSQSTSTVLAWCALIFQKVLMPVVGMLAARPSLHSNVDIDCRFRCNRLPISGLPKLRSMTATGVLKGPCILQSVRQ